MTRNSAIFLAAIAASFGFCSKAEVNAEAPRQDDARAFLCIFPKGYELPADFNAATDWIHPNEKLWVLQEANDNIALKTSIASLETGELSKLSIRKGEGSIPGTNIFSGETRFATSDYPASGWTLTVTTPKPMEYVAELQIVGADASRIGRCTIANGEFAKRYFFSRDPVESS